jgi:succinate dehydrogenase/fumarate reductase-like Fe-S protein
VERWEKKDEKEWALVCVECRALLEECAARNVAYRFAVAEYRTHVSRGLMDSLEGVKNRVQAAREFARQGRMMFQQHKNRHHVE